MGNVNLPRVADQVALPISPDISVIITTYNLEKYIRRAISSVLLQRTKFSVEIIVSDDCSTDSTTKIIDYLHSRYPAILRPQYNNQNIGISRNFIKAHSFANGKYIALLDGDDYWTSSNKLEQQASFLEGDLVHAGHAHQTTKIKDDNSKYRKRFGSSRCQSYKTEDMISHRKFHTSALMYRKSIWDKIGGIPPDISSNERALYPAITLEGPIKYSSSDMCVYRQSGTNLSSRIDYKELEKDLSMVEWLKGLDNNFPALKFKAFLHLCIYTYGFKIKPLPLTRHFIIYVSILTRLLPSSLGDMYWGTVFYFRRLLK